jgi:hypothetical protein
LKLKNTLPFKLVPPSPKMKYLNIKLMKYVHDMHKENCNSDERFKEELITWSNIPSL